MEKRLKIKPKVLMKTIATILTIMMVLQFSSPVALGLKISAILEETETENYSETQSTENTENVESTESTKESTEDITVKTSSEEIIGEITDKRALNQKYFLKNDGTILTAIYPANVHYEENGQMLDIDNSLEDITEDEGMYQNKKNNFKVKFSKKSNPNNLVKLNIRNHNIKWSLSNANKVEATRVDDGKLEDSKLNLNKISSGTIQYENILENIDLQYNVVSDSIKENIILKDKTALEQEIAFEFQTSNLKMEKLEGNEIVIYDKDPEDVVLVIDAPYMYDAKNEICYDIDVELTNKNNNKYTMIIKPSKEWLESEERAYPITIDPTVQTSLYYSDIQDTYIFDGDTGFPNRGSAHILRVGSNNKSPKNATRSLIKFTLPDLKAGDQVIGAMLDICSYPDTDEWAPPQREIQIDVHKMTSDWNVSNASWNNLHSQYDTKVVDYVKYKYDSNEPAKFYYFDITSIVKDWYVTGNNYGVLLKEHVESNSIAESDAYFFSANVHSAFTNGRPLIQIVYRNQTGIENYQTYHTQSVGRAGTIYTNDYNGNLVLEIQDASTSGSLLPVSVSHVYNTNNKDEDIGFGKGFRLNLSQIISLVTINNVEYAKYIDEDATEHYFKREGTSNVYKDEDGLDLTLTLENDTFIMKDKENSKLTFQKRTNRFGERWHLKELEDSFGNKITIHLNPNPEEDFRILKVTDGAGDEISFVYDHNISRLIEIIDNAGRKVSFGYNSEFAIGLITFHDGRQTRYEYNPLHLLTVIRDIDNIHMRYEYYNQKSNRVKSVKEYSPTNQLGKSLNIAYGSNTTTFTDNEGYTNTYTFNNWGQTISIADLGKEDNNIDNALGKMYQYGEEENNKNKLTLDGSLMSVKEKENNLLGNGTFSDGMNCWFTSNCDSGDVVVDGKFRFLGNSNKDRNIGQVVNISGHKGDIFSLAGWVKSNAVPNNSEKLTKVSLSLHIDRNDGTTQIVDTNVNVDGSEWQYVATTIRADQDYWRVIVYLVYSYNENETYFDNIGLFKEEFGQSYTYDTNGNLISTVDNTKNSQTFKYNSNNKLISSINPKGGEFSYEYDTNNSQKLNSATNAVGNKYSFEYTDKGNLTSAKVEESNISEDIGVQYETHISDEGWKSQVENGETSGSDTFNKQMEALKVKLVNAPENMHIQYQAHVSNIGWQDWVQDGGMAGTTGQVLQVEAINIKLINADNYSVKYRAFVKDKGWQNWVKDGEMAGTTGEVKPIYAIQIVIEDKNTENNKYIQTKAEYTSDGNYQTKIIDEAENVTQYEYNENTGDLTKVIDAKNNETNYTYDNSGRVTEVKKEASQKEYTNSYTYENDRLKTITHNGFTYTFIYDDFGNLKQTKVGEQVLSTKNYASNNGNLTSEEYGNSQTISYSYDRFNRLTKVEGTNGKYEYTYNANSNVKTIVDSINNNTETFTYDLAERLVKSINTNGFTKEYEYDINNNVKLRKDTLNNQSNSLYYNFDRANRLTSLKLNDNVTWSNTMDKLSRLSANKITSGDKNYTTSYTFTDVSDVQNKTTTLLKSIKNGENDEISYTYDELGNIETIKKGDTLTNKYYYDELSQLVREDDVEQNKTITYEYDAGGNLLNKKEYPYTTEATITGTPSKTTVYSYENTNWKDQLTSFDGKQITYDNIGNVLTYDGNNYTWQNGRELAGITNSSKNQTITYKYNDSGIRTQKTVNGETTNYYLDGSKVIYEQTGENIIYYIYDENDRVIGLKYNDTQYYYIRNGQNDIIGILDSNLNQIVSYEYDSWGNILSIKDENGNEITDSNNIGLINPYRYRSYRYDTETGLYYLQSRYYSPEWGRFINFDNYGGEIGSLLSHNGYAYCGNNPVNMFDENGNWFLSVFKVFVVVVLAVVTIATTIIPQDTAANAGNLITDVVEGIGDAAKTIKDLVSPVFSKITNKNKTDTQVQRKKTEKSNEKPQYWSADINANKLEPLSYTQAQIRVATGKNVFCRNQMAAYVLVKPYYRGKRPQPERDRDESHYWHYHINSKLHGSPHIWFDGVVYM